MPRVAADKIDADALLSSVDLGALVGKYVPTLKKDGGEFKGLCPFHNETTPSFTVVPSKGWYHCFGCSAHGDAIDFVRHMHNVGFREAVAIIGGETVVPMVAGRRREDPPDDSSEYDGYDPIVPAPADAPPIVAGQWTPKIFNPKRRADPDKRERACKPAAVHTYRNEAGETIGHVLRIVVRSAKKLGKWTPAVLFCTMPDGTRQWCHHPFPSKATLYGQDRLADDPDVPALMVEGEKAVDYLVSLWELDLEPPFIPVCWQGGATQAKHIDWSQLAGRRIVLWPDADEAGAKYVPAQVAGACSVSDRVELVDTLGLPAGAKVTRMPELATGADVLAFLAERAKPASNGPEPEPDEPPPPEAHDDNMVPDYTPDADPVDRAVQVLDKARAKSLVDKIGHATPGPEVEALLREIIDSRVYIHKLDQDVLLETMRDNWGHGKKAFNDLVKEVKLSSKSKQMSRPNSTGDDAVARLMRRYVFVASQNKYYDRNSGNMLEAAAVNTKHLSEMPLNENGMPIPPVYLLTMSGESVDSFNFFPGQPEIIVTEKTRDLNTWKPPQIVPVEGDASPFVDHIGKVMDGNDTLRDYILDYLAHLIQFPHLKIRSTILLISLPGAGKSMVAEWMSHIIGHSSAHSVTNDQISGTFNDYLFGKQFIYVNELMDMESKGTMNKLKEYITTDRLWINPKGYKGFMAVSRVNFLMFSNKEDAIRLDPGDRRWFVYKSKFRPEDQDYYAALWDWFEAKGGDAILYDYLLRRDLSRFDRHAHAPMTDHKRTMQLESVDGWRDHLDTAFVDTSVPLQHDIVNAADVRVWLQQKAGYRNLNNAKICAFLKSVGGIEYDQCKFPNERRRALWVIRKHDYWKLKDKPVIASNYQPPEIF